MSRILIVDDVPEASDVLARLLRHLGHEVATAESGSDTLERLAAADRGAGAEVVLLDVMMPGADGFAVLEAMRADPRTAGVPVVMYTAADDAKLRARAAGAGAQEYLVKGRTSLDELAAAVERAVGDAAASTRTSPGRFAGAGRHPQAAPDVDRERQPVGPDVVLTWSANA